MKKAQDGPRRTLVLKKAQDGPRRTLILKKAQDGPRRALILKKAQDGPRRALTFEDCGEVPLVERGGEIIFNIFKMENYSQISRSRYH